MTFASIPTSSGNSVKPADLANHLLIITPHEYKTGIPTALGEAEAIAVTINDLDTNETHTDVLLFNPGLRGPLAKLIGKQCLARIVQGTSSKPGHTAPWILQDATSNKTDVDRATAFLANGLTAPQQAPAATAPTADGIDMTNPAIAALVAQLGATKA